MAALAASQQVLIAAITPVSIQMVNSEHITGLNIVGMSAVFTLPPGRALDELGN